MTAEESLRCLLEDAGWEPDSIDIRTIPGDDGMAWIESEDEKITLEMKS